MATTDKYGLTAPTDEDVADGPDQLLQVLEQVEDLLSVRDLDLTGGGTIKVQPPSDAAHPLRRDQILYGPASQVPATLPEGSVYLGWDG